MIGIDNKGQISAEYLLVIVVLLLVMGSITIPLVQKSVDATNDISWMSDANRAVDSLVNAVNVVYSNGPESRRTINFYIPKNMDLNITSNQIKIEVPNTGNATGTTNQKLKSYNQPLTKGWYNATITWPAGSTEIEVSITAT